MRLFGAALLLFIVLGVAASSEAATLVSDTTAPSTPTGLIATPFSTSQINLSWTASTDDVGVTGYRIFRGGAQVGTSPTNAYFDTGLTAGTSYFYTVSAYDAAGNNSAQSTGVTSTTLASTGTLQVGPTRLYTTIGAALAAAVDGNTIEIDAGTYNEAVTVSQNHLTLKGIGGYAHLNWGTGNYLTNTTNIPNGKGLMVIDGSGDTVDGLEFSGAKVVDQNGAGIRYEGGDLTIRNSYFHDNENGLMGQGGGSNTLLIENSIFQKNGYCLSSCSHNVYIGYMGHLIFRFNKSIDSHEGHIIKSRAYVNEIISNYLSTKDSDGSYEADFPSGGTVYFIGNVIEQGVNTGNPSILAYGEEGITNSTKVLDVVNNTFYNFLGSGTFLAVSGSPALIAENNIFAGGGTIGPAVDSTNKTLTSSSFVDVSLSDYHLVGGSPAIDGGTSTVLDGTYSLIPQYEYVEPASETPRLVDAVIDSGVYEYSGSGGGTTTVFDFSLSLASNGSVIAGQSVSYPVSVGLVSGTTQAVSLSVSGVPSETTASFSTSSCNPNCTSNLTLTTSSSTPAGSYPITVTGTSGSLSHSASLTMTITTASTTTSLTSGLIGYWPFDEGAGFVTYDASGNGNSGILYQNPIWTTGKVGNALLFKATDNDNNGDDDPRVIIGRTFDVPQLPFTLTTWVNPVNYVDWRAIFSKRDSYTVSQMRSDVGLTTGTGHLYLTTARDTVTFSYAPPLDVWTHIAVVATRSGTALYVNGILWQTLGRVRLGNDATANTVIGGTGEGPGGHNDPFNGIIDEVRIYNRALSASDVQQVYTYTKQ